MIGANACTSCRRLDREKGTDTEDEAFCSSFPEGIPVEVWEGSHAHRVPLGDEETWSPIPGWEDSFDSYVQVFEAVNGEKPKGLPPEEPNPG